jgi:predicted RNase H-like HicB family nuclease
MRRRWGCFRREVIVKDYHINIFYSDEDKCYVADIPDLKYCSALGPTPENALREVQIAKAAWLKAAKVLGKRVPKPRYRPAIYQTVR